MTRFFSQTFAQHTSFGLHTAQNVLQLLLTLIEPKLCVQEASPGDKVGA